jgi:hypothetical protein
MTEPGFVTALHVAAAATTAGHATGSIGLWQYFNTSNAPLITSAAITLPVKASFLLDGSDIAWATYTLPTPIFASTGTYLFVGLWLPTTSPYNFAAFNSGAGNSHPEEASASIVDFNAQTYVGWNELAYLTYTPYPSGAKVWNGSANVKHPVKTWNGSAWVRNPVKTWNGSAWQVH